MGTKWPQATYVGHSMLSNVYSLCSPDGVAEARSLCRRLESERWDADVLASIKTTPWFFRELPEPSVTFMEPEEQTGPAGDAVPAGARKMRINQSDLDNSGYTDRCPQCEHAKKHCKIRPGGNHSDSPRTDHGMHPRHRGGTEAPE